MNTPVVFFFFNKQQTTKQVFEQIKKAKPQKLYLISDGPRNDNEKAIVTSLREWIEGNVNWETKIIKLYSDCNLGCKNRIVSGLNEVFIHEQYAIILEDDCLPNQDFFIFCEDMLKYYQEVPQIMMVCGGNLLPQKLYQIKDDYTFSANTWIWGWATWQRAWKLYDPDICTWPEIKKKHILDHAYNASFQFMSDLSKGFDSVYQGKLNTWDYQWRYSIWTQHGLAIIPKYNMVKNLGFTLAEATHTTGNLPKYLNEIFKRDDYSNYNKHHIHHKKYIVRDTIFDGCFDKLIKKEASLLKRIAFIIAKHLRIRSK